MKIQAEQILWEYVHWTNAVFRKFIVDNVVANWENTKTNKEKQTKQK